MDKNEARKKLKRLARERDTLPDRTGEAIDQAREAGLVWTDIAAELHISHPAVIKAHRRWKERQ